MSISRRSFCLTALAGSCLTAATRGTLAPNDTRRYADPITEHTVYRLTDPGYRSLMLPLSSRPVNGRSNAIYYLSDRLGTMQAWRQELKVSSQAKQLTDAAELRIDGISVSADDRWFCYQDGRTLQQSSVSTLRNRELYTLPEGAEWAGSPVISEDGLWIAFGERNANRYRLQLLRYPQATVQTLWEGSEPLSEVSFRPQTSLVLCRQGTGYAVLGAGRKSKLLKLRDGENRNAQWAADGSSLYYLNLPESRKELNNIREYLWDGDQDKLVTKTSQYGAFGRNGDASVFVGASLSKASPCVILVLRLGRELTLCEHRATDVSLVRPTFSPNSQRIFFQSDKFGKPALFSMQVEKLVELTENSTD